MNPFDNKNPLAAGGLLFNCSYTLQSADENRIADSSSVLKLTTISTFLGSDPQLVQRLTENLVLLEDMETMQKSPFRIATELKLLSIEKGHYILDNVTSKRYRIIAYYSHHLGFDFTVTELND